MASNINSDGIVAGYVMAGIWLVAGLMICIQLARLRLEVF